MPPEAEVRAFTRCVVELLEVWGRASVRALDLLPVLRVLPNRGLRELLRLVERRDAFVEAQIRRHEECPSPPGDTVLGALQGRDPGVRGGPLSPPRLHMALVDLFIGGTETTAAALAWAIAFLLHRPEVPHLQERLRAELWRELGPTGTPQAGDTGRLPLLHATITETLRLRPPAPLALPHCARRHTSVGGIPVPAGSILVPNLLAAHQDPDTWHHPEAFLPERFLVPGAPWRALVPFGCGARSCLGEGLARAELFVFLGQILQEFRLEPPAPGVCPAWRCRQAPSCAAHPSASAWCPASPLPNPAQVPGIGALRLGPPAAAPPDAWGGSPPDACIPPQTPGSCPPGRPGPRHASRPTQPPGCPSSSPPGHLGSLRGGGYRQLLLPTPPP
ncbi:steroid 21-hydroxylase-like [Aptenodytes patagonicus]|uniref:steroid 21-hydroxylase-like n=1 Tax=Aptenodytes patagonicus TaxID=9234 RepID=UPI003FA0583F